jgi:putative MATE family efflux protein
MVSQNVLNLVDTAMVGTLGDGALAAVGLGGFLNFLTSAFVLGLAAGVQSMASRRVGEGRYERAAVPLNGGLLLSVALAVPWSAFLFFATPHLYTALNDDPAVVSAGGPYLRARLVAMTAMGMNFAFRGYWNATNRTMLYLRTIVLMHVLNVGLNWVLIFGKFGAPELGAAGAGVASAIATYVGTCSYLYLGFRHARSEGFFHRIPDRETLRTIVRVSAPSSLQQVFFAAGMTAFFWIVGRVGTPQLAATHVLVHLMLVGILPGLGFGLASASLVGQALGRGDSRDAHQWAWDVARVTGLVVAVIAAPAVLFPETILAVFIHDPETRSLAVGPLRLLAVFMPLDAVGMVMMHSLIGAGDTRRTMIVSIGLQWALFLPVAYLCGPVLGLGLMAIWAANVVYRLLLGACCAALWRKGQWSRIRL